MWLLISTLCLVTEPYTAECRKHVSQPFPDLTRCAELKKPMVDYLTKAADDIGATVVYVASGCKRGSVL